MSKPYDDWNKKYLFFSGGQANYPDEIALYKSVNDSVINKSVSPAPLAGNYYHFYKTTTPLTDFGPYDESTIRNSINEGAVFISYIGHSGTATWDNSISDVKQLKNKVNRNPVISDFGCSTNKFAEPDIVAFGERFVLEGEGQALGYIGNSALGFVSTAIKAPGNFYKSIIQDSIFGIGKAHLRAKYLMFEQLGSSNVVNQFSFSNTLIGDPIVKIQIPNKPNLTITPKDIVFEDNLINDAIDSFGIKAVLNNFGTLVPQNFKFSFTHSYQNSVIKQYEQTQNLPRFKDTLSFYINVLNKPGQHTLAINLDLENAINEIDENDNNAVVQFNVASSSIRDMLVQRNENPKIDSLIILNPTSKIDNSSILILEASSNENFSTAQQFNFPLDTFSTKIALPSLMSNDRTWLRYKLNSGIEWSNPLSYSKLSGAKYLLNDDYVWSKQQLVNLLTIDNHLELTKDTLDQGEESKLSFYIYNSGEAPANNFNVQVEVIRPDNSRVSILEQDINSLAPGEKKFFEAVFNTEFEAGNRTYKINVDSADKVLEYYKDNNIYLTTFFIKADTTTPNLIVAFNGNDIMDGDYISPIPTIRMELSDPSNLPIIDTSAICDSVRRCTNLLCTESKYSFLYLQSLTIQNGC